MITVKLSDLKNMESGVTKILSADLPIKIAYDLHKSVKPIRSELNALDEMRNNLVKKYATEEKEGGSFMISPGTENFEKFNKEFTELLDKEVSIPIEPIGLGILPESIKMSPIEMDALIGTFMTDDTKKEDIDVPAVPTAPK